MFTLFDIIANRYIIMKQIQRVLWGAKQRLSIDDVFKFANKFGCHFNSSLSVGSALWRENRKFIAGRWRVGEAVLPNGMGKTMKKVISNNILSKLDIDRAGAFEP